MARSPVFLTRKKKKLFFYIAILIIPLLQLSIFYFYTNIRSFTLAFTEYDGNGNYNYVGLDVFKKIFLNEHPIFKTFIFESVVKNSLLMFIAGFVFGSFPAILFSYYIYKKFVYSDFFKMILYLPHILSTLVFVIIYKYFMNDLLPSFGIVEIGYWESTISAERFYYMFFTVFFSFGVSVLLYSGTMSGISDSLIESGKIDGVSSFGELFYIVLPMIWGTFVTFTITSIISLFTNQMSGYAFKGGNFNPQLQTFGYFLFSKTANVDMATFPILSALGMIMTLIAVPVTLLTRFLMVRFGPSVD